MARKTVISKVVEENAQDGVIEFPQNRTLYADQFTDIAPNTDEDREGFKAKSDAYNSVIRQLEKNKTLRNALKNDAARGDLKNALKALLAELEDAE